MTVGGDAETEEGNVPRRLRDPKKPSQAEVEEHNITHYPYREWCPHCRDGKGQNNQHRTDKTEEKEKLEEVPKISFDYWFMGEEDHKAQKNPLMMMYDGETTAVCPFAVGRKGSKTG